VSKDKKCGLFFKKHLSVNVSKIFYISESLKKSI